MSTVLWIGRVRRGTELNTMRKAGLDCRLFFDAETAERFLIHHAGDRNRVTSPPLPGSTRGDASASIGASPSPQANPIFAVVAAEGKAVAMFSNPAVAKILQEKEIHSYAVTAMTTKSILDSGMILRQNPSQTCEEATTAGGSGGEESAEVGTSPSKSGRTGVLRKVAYADPNTVKRPDGASPSYKVPEPEEHQKVLIRTSGPAEGSAVSSVSPPSVETTNPSAKKQHRPTTISTTSPTRSPIEPTLGKEPSDGDLVRSHSLYDGIEVTEDQLVPEFVKAISQEKVQEEIVAKFMERLNKTSQTGTEASTTSSSIPAAQNDQRYLSSMVNLAVPPPEGVPPDCTFLGEGPSGSVWRLAEEQTATKSEQTGDGKSRQIARAIRVLPDKLMEEPYYSILEAQLKLQHPKITGPLKLEADPKTGKTKFITVNAFHAHLERSFRSECVPEPVMINALFSLLQAAGEAHSKGIVVRSVTPYIVAFDHDNVIRVSSTYFVPLEHKTAYPEWLITAYCAPETVANNDVTKASDIWGIGCLALRMVTSQNPWQKLQDKAILEQAKAMTNMVADDAGEAEIKEMVQHQFLHHIPSGSNTHLVDLITRCMHPNPAKRPTCDDLLTSPLFSHIAAVLGEGSADEQELNSASARILPLGRDTKEYAEVRDAVGRALLKQRDASQGFVELVGAARVENKLLRQRFQTKLSYIGNSTVGFYGAPAPVVPSLLRYGVLRSSHRLNPADMSKWEERGSIGSTKLGVYVCKYPGMAIKYTSKEPLPIGTTSDVVMFEVALGDAKVTTEKKYYSDAEIKADPHHSFLGENEIYLREEVQLNPTYIIRLRTVAPTISHDSSSTSYHIMMNRSLGKGSFGSVKLAIQYPRGRPVAVKIFDVVATEEKYCRAEFETLVKLRDFRHIMKVHHYEIKDGVAYMFMELLSTSILDLIKGFGPMPEEVVIRYMIQGAAGLESLRLEGLVHRDVKPANMMLAYDGTLKLTDFGLSPNAVIEDTSAHSCFPVGSPAYWSPELLNGVAHSPESDVWALAASMCHMLSGSTPFKHLGTVTLEQLAFAIGSHSSIPVVPDHISPFLKELLNKCFSVNPEERPSLALLANPETYLMAMMERNESTESIVLSSTNRGGTDTAETFGAYEAGDSIAFSHGGTTGNLNWTESGGSIEGLTVGSTSGNSLPPLPLVSNNSSGSGEGK